MLEGNSYAQSSRSVSGSSRVQSACKSVAEFTSNTAQNCLSLESGRLTNTMEKICNFKFAASAEENVKMLFLRGQSHRSVVKILKRSLQRHQNARNLRCKRSSMRLYFEAKAD